MDGLVKSTSNENQVLIYQDSASNEVNNLVLELETRNVVINNLTQFSILLHGKSMSKDDKDKMIKNNKELIIKLVCLPLMVLDENKKQSKAISNDSIKDDLVLCIDNDTRLKIIDSLIRNINHSIHYANSILADAKVSLIRENNKLINSLLNWTVKLVKIDDQNSLIDEETYKASIGKF